MLDIKNLLESWFCDAVSSVVVVVLDYLPRSYKFHSIAAGSCSVEM